MGYDQWSAKSNPAVLGHGGGRDLVLFCSCGPDSLYAWQGYDAWPNLTMESIISRLSPKTISIRTFQSLIKTSHVQQRFS